MLPSIEAEPGAGIATGITKVIKSTPVLPPGSRITPLLSGTKIQSRTPVISTTTDKMPGLKAGVYKIQVKGVKKQIYFPWLNYFQTKYCHILAREFPWRSTDDSIGTERRDHGAFRGIQWQHKRTGDGCFREHHLQIQSPSETDTSWNGHRNNSSSNARHSFCSKSCKDRPRI